MVQRFIALTLCLTTLAGYAAEEDEIVRLAFEGNEYFSTETLDVGLGVRVGQLHSERRLERAAERLETLYRDNGFFEASVGTRVSERFGLRGGLIVYFEIDEGPPSPLAEVRVNHNGLLDQALIDELLAENTTEIWTLAYDDLLEVSLRRLFADNGYLYVSIVVEDHFTEEGVRVVLNVQEGPRVRVGAIEIAGNEPILERVVRREVTFEPGGWINLSAIYESQRNIYATGVFTNAGFKIPEREERAEVVTVRFEVEPDKTRWFSFTLGYEYSQTGGSGAVFEAAWGDDNLFGNLQRLEVGAAFRYNFAVGQFERELYQAIYREPWLLSLRGLSGRLRLYLERERLASYKSDSYGFDLGLDYAFNEQYAVGGGLRFERSNLWEVSQEASSEDLELQGYRNTTAPYAQFVIDLRDNAFIPSRGVYSKSYLEVAGGMLGGDNDYLKATQELNGYLGLSDSLILALHAYTGLGGPYDDSVALPIYERFFLGGSYSLRGFPERSVGPRDAGDEPVGGAVALLANAELRLRLGESDFSLGFFTDSGMVWPGFDQFDLTDLALGVGAGLRYMTPIGPLRLDIGFVAVPGRTYLSGASGYEPTDADHGDGWQIHLALGHIF